MNKLTTMKINFGKTVSELIQSIIVLGFLYGFIVKIINHAYYAFGNDITIPLFIEPYSLKFIKICEVVANEPSDLLKTICEVLFVCTLTAVILYYLLVWIYSKEWVQEEISIKKCWEEIVWYNPWSWVTTLVCIIKEVLRYVLKVVCFFKKPIVLTLVIVCIIVELVMID